MSLTKTKVFMALGFTLQKRVPLLVAPLQVLLGFLGLASSAPPSSPAHLPRQNGALGDAQLPPAKPPCTSGCSPAARSFCMCCLKWMDLLLS